MPSSVVRIQISGSGAFSEPNNGIEVYVIGMPVSDAAKVSVIDIPGSTDGVAQSSGASAKRERVQGVSIGTYAFTKKQKEEGLDNLIRHSSSASWQGRPVSVSFILNGATEETFPAFVTNYEVIPRRGRPRFSDVIVELVRLP